MQGALIIGVLCLVLPALSWAGPSTGWWGFGSEQGECEIVSELHVPLRYMERAESRGVPYRMEDVEEQGQLVETTMIAPGLFFAGMDRMTWYRSRERCVQAWRRARQSQAEEQRHRERYR